MTFDPTEKQLDQIPTGEVGLDVRYLLPNCLLSVDKTPDAVAIIRQFTVDGVAIEGHRYVEYLTPQPAPKQEEPTMTATKATGPVVTETVTRKRIVPGEYAGVVRVYRDMSVATAYMRTTAHLTTAIAILTEIRDAMLENEQ